jgi:hypothetical protein
MRERVYMSICIYLLSNTEYRKWLQKEFTNVDYYDVREVQGRCLRWDGDMRLY